MTEIASLDRNQTRSARNPSGHIRSSSRRVRSWASEGLVRLAAITPIAQPPSGAAVSTGGDVAAANEAPAGRGRSRSRGRAAAELTVVDVRPGRAGDEAG